MGDLYLLRGEEYMEFRWRQRKAVQKIVQLLYNQPWMKRSEYCGIEKNRLTILQSFCLSLENSFLKRMYDSQNEKRPGRELVVDFFLVLKLAMVMVIWELGSAQSLSNYLKQNAWVQQIIGIKGTICRTSIGRKFREFSLQITKDKKDRPVIIHVNPMIENIDPAEMEELVTDSTVIDTTFRASGEIGKTYNGKGFHKGLKVHALMTCDGRTPIATAITPANVGDAQGTEYLIPIAGRCGCKRLIGDAGYDSSRLFELAENHGLALTTAVNLRGTGTTKKIGQKEVEKRISSKQNIEIINNIKDDRRRKNALFVLTENGKKLLKKRVAGEHLFGFLKDTLGLGKHRLASFNQAAIVITAVLWAKFIDEGWQRKTGMRTRLSPKNRDRGKILSMNSALLHKNIIQTIS